MQQEDGVKCGKVKVEEGTQMHSEVKKFNRDKAEIIDRQRSKSR